MRIRHVCLDNKYTLVVQVKGVLPSQCHTVVARCHTSVWGGFEVQEQLTIFSAGKVVRGQAQA